MKGGNIVNTASVNGLGGARGAALYSAAKAGILALTKSAAQEYAAQNIRVNALVAGGFRTPMLESALEHASGGNAEVRNLGGHLKTGHAWSLQNRPYEMARDVILFYPAFS